MLFSEIEDLSNIESKLINKIKNYSSNKVDSSKKEIVQKQIPQSEKTISFDLGVFMICLLYTSPSPRD